MPAAEQTQGIRLEDPDFNHVLAQTQSKLQANNPSSLGEIILLSEKGQRHLDFLANERAFILGRFTQLYRYTNFIDLTPFGGKELGVSRIHAQIHLENDAIYLTDLNSKNGTFLSGMRMDANQPTKLHSGDVITLGRLHLQLAFRMPDIGANS